MTSKFFFGDLATRIWIGAPWFRKKTTPLNNITANGVPDIDIKIVDSRLFPIFFDQYTPTAIEDAKVPAISDIHAPRSIESIPAQIGNESCYCQTGSSNITTTSPLDLKLQAFISLLYRLFMILKWVSVIFKSESYP